MFTASCNKVLTVINALFSLAVMESTDHRDDGLMAAKRAAGTFKAIAERLGLTPQAISRWKKIPPVHVMNISEFTGIPPHILRKDVFRVGKPNEK
jgi:hypothetical protein